jgi:RNA polymerase-binding transcription factor DksA
MDTAEAKKRLAEEKASLEKELPAVGAKKNPAVPGDFEPADESREDEADLLDVAKNAQEFEENEGVERDLEARYDAVLAALERIEAGTYGTCMVCGEAIEPERLAADPAATTCIAHK